MLKSALALFATMLVLATTARATSGGGPTSAAHIPSQAAADVLREVAGTDGAFLAAGMVKESYQADNLASLLQYPTDELVIVSLTGAQIRQAFERTLSLYPLPNTSFLQISGFEVQFSKSAESGRRVTSATASGVKLDDDKTYTVAMPSSLGRGGLGYFKIWDKSRITKTIGNVTVESALKGKRFIDSSPRWVAQP